MGIRETDAIIAFDGHDSRPVRRRGATAIIAWLLLSLSGSSCSSTSTGSGSGTDDAGDAASSDAADAATGPCGIRCNVDGGRADSGRPGGDSGGGRGPGADSGELDGARTDGAGVQDAAAEGGTPDGADSSGADSASDPCQGADNGTPCGDALMICLDEQCVGSFCGDGFVDAANDEVCDDGNDVPDDGCEPSCERSCTPEADDCDDGNPCNGVETCGTDFICRSDGPLDCDDEDACTADSCDVVSGCLHTLIDEDGDQQAPTSLGACGTDCNDDSPSVHQGAADPCDGIDNDCDDAIDEDGTVTWWQDCDGDGYAAVSAASRESCARPTQSTACAGGTWVSLNPATSADCNDGAAGVHPGATETPGDETDQNCDGQELCYRDGDGDGYRSTTTVQSNDVDCDDAGEAEASDPSGDCNDGDDTIHPGATQIVGDGIDQDCGTPNEICYRDTDNDGYRTTSTVASSDADCNDSGEARATEPSGDCNDNVASIRPGAQQIVGDGIDQDCGTPNEICYRDTDNDGYRTTSTIASSDTDCNDPGEARASEPTGDCCDTDGDARPNQTGWFDYTDGPTACGNWNYNCDQEETKRYTGSRNTCGFALGSGCGTPSSASGWVTVGGLCAPIAPSSSPACGSPPYCWASNCHQNGPTSCTFDFTTRAQQCQ